MLLFTLGNLLSGFASGYGAMLAGRIITGVAHGVFFSIGAKIATSLAARSRGARAVALMFAGLTVAMVVGVPSGTFIGQRLEWRAPSFAIAGNYGGVDLRRASLDNVFRQAERLVDIADRSFGAIPRDGGRERACPWCRSCRSTE